MRLVRFLTTLALVLSTTGGKADPTSGGVIADAAVPATSGPEGLEKPQMLCDGKPRRVYRGKKAIDGAVTVRFVVETDGKTSEIEAVGRARRPLFLSVKRWLRRCAFRPAMLDSRPLRLPLIWHFRFLPRQ